jgi:hypothetical protein
MRFRFASSIPRCLPCGYAHGLLFFWYPAVISLLFGPFSLPKLRIPAGGGDLVADNLLQKQQKQQRTGTAGLRRATKKMYRKTQLEDDRRRFGTRFGPG